jgi:hypothetical protein
MKKINSLFILLFCSSLLGQNVNSVLKDTFKYRDFVFYNKVYSYENNEFANKRKIAILKNLNKEYEDFYWGDTMGSHLVIADLYVAGPYDFILKTSLNQIREAVFQRPDDKNATSFNQDFKQYCREIVDSSAYYGFQELEQSLKVTSVFNNFITIGNNIYDFSGGAHPNHYHNHFVIDLNDGKMIAFHDVFQSNSKSKLKSILKAKFISIYGKESLLDQFEIAENFAIDKDGIHFLYNPYEITAYAFGDPEITISFNQAMPYLTPWFKQFIPSTQKLMPKKKSQKPTTIKRR